MNPNLKFFYWSIYPNFVLHVHIFLTSSSQNTLIVISCNVLLQIIIHLVHMTTVLLLIFNLYNIILIIINYSNDVQMCSELFNIFKWKDNWLWALFKNSRPWFLFLQLNLIFLKSCWSYRMFYLFILLMFFIIFWYWPPVREVCPNYEVVDFQPCTLTTTDAINQRNFIWNSLRNEGDPIFTAKIELYPRWWL